MARGITRRLSENLPWYLRKSVIPRKIEKCSGVSVRAVGALDSPPGTPGAHARRVSGGPSEYEPLRGGGVRPEGSAAVERWMSPSGKPKAGAGGDRVAWCSSLLIVGAVSRRRGQVANFAGS
jgi:hypothetical protein